MNERYPIRSIVAGTLLACLLLGGLNTFVIMRYGFDIWHAIRDSVVSVQFWFLGGLIIANTIRFYFPKQSRLVFFTGLIVTMTAVWQGISYLLIHFIFRKVPGYISFLETSMPVRIAFTLLLFTAVAMIFAFINTLLEQQMVEERNAEVQRISKETELNNLQEKLHPHFLFNSLNSINALVAINTVKARDMVQQLSDFLRSTLKRDSREWIEMENEMGYLRQYLDIEKVRFGDRLQVDLSIEPTSEKLKLPPFILLPLLENAIKFGLYDTLGETRITLQAQTDDHSLVVTITNPFDPQTAGQYKGTGFGLRSVNRRLYLLFGRSDLLKTSTEGDIFSTTVKIPQTV
ncbi:MAG TPA: histidine kinase [Phnomibacter sp.]|nr:histidine kinase [Phnomibacter sp.]